MKKLLVTPLLALCFSTAAQAQVSVKDAWVRATVPQQKVTGAFLQITSVKEMRLVAISSPVAASAELHKMEMDGDVMKMRAIDELALPAGKMQELKPGSYHIMLMNLKAPVKEGELVPLTLVVEGKDRKRESIQVQAIAKSINQAAAPAMHH
ncbi:copper chaperone PCu(A)C [Undibacterium parvum]|uniref:Copper chaperone PCu(A)C n=1 Tax=Undibacterium parvum TaxID=401471 RepID=A0A3Q9BQZ5_9BURK|nr:copper chaperone PCu(A)C [Undibacterium parvum]AZP12523.1 copper chaperone PCu(A)C [Undibacterium parvum]